MIVQRFVRPDVHIVLSLGVGVSLSLRSRCSRDKRCMPRLLGGLVSAAAESSMESRVWTPDSGAPIAAANWKLTENPRQLAYGNKNFY